LGLFSCSSPKQKLPKPPVYVVSAMKNVMWKGELGSRIDLDTLKKSEGLFGIGPLAGLRGEISIFKGDIYVSKMADDSTQIVELNQKASAPFFVYDYENEWQNIQLESYIKTIADLERFIDSSKFNIETPFPFYLEGFAESAIYHIQNLAPGTKVSNPQEAHQGQKDFLLQNEAVTLVGFFSKEHKGVFTHHDRLVHIHLINEAKNKMGHLDEINMEKMTLYIPKQ